MPWISSFAARQVPFATFAKGTNRTRHAHCLIVPTGRTRRDPDHRVTGLRRGVAESPSMVPFFTWEFEFLNPHRGPEPDADCAHSEVNPTSNRIDAPLDAPIRNEPDECDQHIEGVSDPDFEEGQQDRRGIEHRRYL